MGASPTLNIDWHSYYQQWRGLPAKSRNGEAGRSAFVATLAERLQVSPATVRRHFNEIGGLQREVERTPQTNMDLIHELAKVLGLADTLQLKGSRRRLATKDGIDIMVQEGVEGAEQLTESTANHWLERLGYRDADPKQRYEADYACQQMQLDFSRSKYFQIKTRLDDGDWLLVTSAKELHYKHDSYKLRTWLVQILDEHSRLRLVRAFAATAESALLGITFLDWALRRPEDDHMLRHLPERLKLDNGAFYKARESQDLMDTLGIEPIPIAPGNSDSTGKIERSWRTTWTSFELKLAVQLLRQQGGTKAQIRLSQYNAALMQFLVAEHAKPHPTRRGVTRGAAYQQSLLQHPPRSVDVDLLTLACQTWERKADTAGVISIDNVRFQVHRDAYNKWVRVYRNRENEFVAEIIGSFRKPFKLRPFRASDLDTFKAPTPSYAQQVRREVLAEQTEKKAANAPKPLLPAAEAVQPITPHTQAAEPDAPEVLTATQARAAVGEALRQIGSHYAEHAAQLDLLLFDGIQRNQVNRIIAHLFQTARCAS